MKNTARILLVGMAISIFCFLWPKNSPPKDRISAQSNPAPQSVSLATHDSASTDISRPMLRPAPAQLASNPLADRLAMLHSKLDQWQDSLIHDPDDEEG